MKMNTKQFLAGLALIVSFASCSRPVAYFQPTAREHFATAPTMAAVTTPVEASVPVSAEAYTSTIAATPVEQSSQTNAALDQVNALVRNDSKLSADKTVQKRLIRVKNLLTETSAKAALTPASTTAPKKMNLLERLMVKKMNNKISKQLAPNHPEKAMANKGLLVGGLVLALVGLLLALLATGTGSTIGVVLLLLGAVAFVLGLLAS